MAGSYSARSALMAPLHWPTLPPPRTPVRARCGGPVIGQRGCALSPRGRAQAWAVWSEPGGRSCARGPSSRRGPEAAPRATGRPSRRRDLPRQRPHLTEADYEESSDPAHWLV